MRGYREQFPDVVAAATRGWNRGCNLDSGPSTEGDRILRAVILFDAVAHNGGLGHALEGLGDREVDEALVGFRRFGLPGAARVVEAARLMDDEDAREAMSDQYIEAADSLDAAFESYYLAHSDEFASPD